MISVRAKGTNISRRVMNEAMTYHLVFAFETLADFTPWTAWHGAVVGAYLRVYVCVRVQKILCLKGGRVTTGHLANVGANLGRVCDTIYAHAVRRR